MPATGKGGVNKGFPYGADKPTGHLMRALTVYRADGTFQELDGMTLGNRANVNLKEPPWGQAIRRLSYGDHVMWRKETINGVNVDHYTRVTPVSDRHP